MRFNTHCHVFNLQSIFNDDTATILEARLRDDRGLPPHMAQGIVNTLRRFIATKGGFASVGSDPGDFSNTWRNDPLSRLTDFWEAMHLAMLTDMDMVTDDMVRQFPVGSDVAFVPLMMDILIAPQSPGTNDPLFQSQIEGTLRQVRRYPGRMLPFYAVNPFRDGFVDKAIAALDEGGFVGVKLYPSLGHSLDAPGMDAVLRHCDGNAIPITMHCNHGGFKKDDASTGECSPLKWGLGNAGDGYLDLYPKLKICFAHFGGGENFADPNMLTGSSWTRHILALMEAYPRRVFADVAFHDTALTHPIRPVYFNNLAAVLFNPAWRSQVLWGTDTWLLRMVCKELEYWGKFMPTAVTEDNFKLLCKSNPRSFLGINDLAPKRNIVRHMQYLQKNANWTQEQTGNWLRDAAS